MKATLALDFSDACQAADFFAALSDAYRKVAAGAQKVVETAVAALDLPVANGGGRSGVSAPVEAVDVTPVRQPDTTASETAPAAPRKRRTKAEMEAARAAEASTPLESAIAETAPSDAAAAVEITDEQLRKVGNALMTAKGGPVVMEIMQKYKIRRYPDCPADQRAAFLKDCNDAALKA